ncbi:alpha/beta hydrolase [Cellulomonas sp.]|uniref:alpha/beta hydrolase n=1 Tax=Cellulomonas sp. TaxID=40001 RepID=UPI0028113B1F|nr:alpha/beta hydrolase [Cellulomonas sp.]
MSDDALPSPAAPVEPLLPFSGLLAMLEPLDEFRGDGPSPEEVVAAFPQWASVDVEDLTVDGPNGPVAARLYRPGGPDAAPVRAACVWVHGGAFVMGTLDMAESHAVGLALAHRGVAVLALDYRKALRGVRHPVPLEDVAAGWAWAREHADALGVAPDDLHLGGASAGGALVAGLTLRLRDRGEPLPRSLVLAYTAVHAGPVGPPEELARIRAVTGDAFADDFMDACCANYAGPAIGDPYAFAANGDATGLPPTLVLTCELDVLRFSAEEWAKDATDAGVDVVLEDLPGARHGVLDQPTTPHGRAMTQRIGDWLLAPEHRHRG